MIRLMLYLALIWTILRLEVLPPSSNDSDPFDIETARLTEARRRLRMLGKLAEGEYDYRKFRQRAAETLLPMPLLKTWHDAYRTTGLGGLQPDWQSLEVQSQVTVFHRRTMLGDIADAEIVTDEDIKALASTIEWREGRVRDWLLRYRRGGLWALAPENYPYGSRRHKKGLEQEYLRAPGTLYPKDYDEIERRTLRLGWLLEKVKVTSQDVVQRAEEAKCSQRILWRDLSLHRRYGPIGLARQERADKGERHSDDWYTRIIIACRLSKPDATVNWVYEEVCRRARRRGFSEPSFWRVRSVCEQINRGVTTIADGRENEFRNKYRFAGRLKIDGVVYEIDHTPVDVLVKDLRSAKYRSKSGLIRPFLTLVIEANSRFIVAAVFSYDEANRFTVAEALRRALIISEDHLYGGIPAEIWVDRGKDLIAKFIYSIARGLGFNVHPTYCPEHKPHVERFFETLNTRLWSTLDGYTGSNTKERHPEAERRAKLTIAELEREFWKFINDKYHQEAHSELDVTPPSFWDEHCFTEAADPHLLHTLMMEPKSATVTKGRISLDGRLYLHPELATLAGERVLVRRPTHYAPPDTIEVYQRGQWICSAIALDSELADSITGKDVREAQRTQRQTARRQINQAKQDLADDDREAINQPTEPTAPAKDSQHMTIQSKAPAKDEILIESKRDREKDQSNGSLLRKLAQQTKQKKDQGNE